MRLVYKNEQFSIDDVMRVLLAERNISQRELARRTGIHTSNIKNFFQKRENGILGYLAISQMLNALDYTARDIERIAEEMRKDSNAYNETIAKRPGNRKFNRK